MSRRHEDSSVAQAILRQQVVGPGARGACRHRAPRRLNPICGARPRAAPAPPPSRPRRRPAPPRPAPPRPDAVSRTPFLALLDSEPGGDPASGCVATNASALRASPVFGLRYAARYTKFLAMGDEDGYVSILDTARPPPAALDDQASPRRAKAQWTAHRNAIFDLAWARADEWVYTASGDTTLALWDTAYAEKVAVLRGHAGSVKAVAVSPRAPEIVASGARDGALMLWDARAPAAAAPAAARGGVAGAASGAGVAAVAVARDAHAPPAEGRRRSGKTPLQGRPAPSVTAVAFLSEGAGHLLASGGVDGVVRLWDVRRVAAPYARLDAGGAGRADENAAPGGDAPELAVLAAGAPPRLGARRHAVTSLSLRPGGAQLLASLTGGHHLVYDVARPDAGPVRWFGGHSVASFYVKACWSPDGGHLASGSSDGLAYIWAADGDGTAPLTLAGHEREVTTVAWCPTDPCQLASAADDCTVRVWNVARRQAEERRAPPARRGAALARAAPAALRRELLAAAFVEGSEGTPSGAAVLGAGALVRLSTGRLAGAAAPEPAMPAPAASPPAPQAAAAPAAAAPRRMRVSNALRRASAVAAAAAPKRTKQQTLMQALGAGRSAGAAAAVAAAAAGAAAAAAEPAAKRVRPGSTGAGGLSSEDEGSAAAAVAAAAVAAAAAVGGSQDENASGN
jgi:denticleless